MCEADVSEAGVPNAGGKGLVLGAACAGSVNFEIASTTGSDESHALVRNMHLVDTMINETLMSHMCEQVPSSYTLLPCV